MNYGLAAAETALERRASRITILDQFKEPLSPREVIWCVAHFYPESSEMLWAGIQSGALSPKNYQAEWEKLLEDFEKHQFVQRLESHLEKLMQ